MNRKAMAKETLEIIRQGYYEPTVKNETKQKLEKKLYNNKQIISL